MSSNSNDASPPALQTFASLNPVTGLIEVCDINTGAVLAIQQSREDLLARKMESLVPVALPDGREILLERGIPIEAVIRVQSIPFSDVLVDLICDEIVQGKTLHDICSRPGMPSYGQLLRWRKQRPDVEARIKTARLERAEAYHDRIIQEIDNVDEDNHQAKKVQIDTLKWAAEKGNPDSYGNKTKVTSEKIATVRVVVETGIRRQSDVEAARPVEELNPGTQVEESNGVHLPQVEVPGLGPPGVSGLGDAASVVGDGSAGTSGNL